MGEMKDVDSFWTIFVTVRVKLKEIVINAASAKELILRASMPAGIKVQQCHVQDPLVLGLRVALVASRQARGVADVKDMLKNILDDGVESMEVELTKDGGSESASSSST